MLNQQNEIQVVGFDPSLRNWGMSKGVLKPDGTIVITELEVIDPVLPKGKQVRVNSNDLEAANQITHAAIAFAKGAQAIFVEVPVGSQSARPMASYGICVGILGALRAIGIPFIEVNPAEVKHVTGIKNASKLDMITWAMKKHPEVNWPMKTEKGVTSVVAGTAEHMADATAAIYAGINTNSFKQSLQLLRFKQAA